MDFRQGLLMFGLRIIIGICIGVVAWLSTVVETQVVVAKFALVRQLVRENRYLDGWLALMGFVVPLATLAALLTFWAPGAAGSGIPHVKAYLNGNNVRGALTLRALVAKVVGVTCCVACGMPAGREGPMVRRACPSVPDPPPGHSPR
jgi:chloride channel 7